MGRMALLEEQRVEGRVELRGEGGEHGKVTWGRGQVIIFFHFSEKDQRPVITVWTFSHKAQKVK